MTGSRKLRLWPLGLIAVLAVAGLIWVRAGSPDNRQDQMLGSQLVFVLTGIALLLWLLLLSRMRWRVRGLVLLVVIAVCGALAASVRMRGLSGDVVPVFEWRWAGEIEELPAPAPVVMALAVPVGAADYPQFLGPSRDGVLAAPRLAREWPDDLAPLWRIPIGPAWSGFAVVGPYAVTQEQRGEQELVTSYDLATGSLVWSHADTTRHDDPLGGPGPRATPTIAAGRVFAQGATGMLNALDLASGEPLWSVNVLDAAGAPRPEYGLSTSPLVDAGRVIVVVGGLAGQALVAYDAATGQRLWAGGSDPAGYSSPLVAEFVGQRQIVVFNRKAVSGHDSADGAVLWRFPFVAVQHVAQPVVLSGDRLFVSAGYGAGGRLLRIRRTGEAFEVDLEWESRGLKAKFTNVVLRADTLYGLDDGILVALDVATGERRWKGGRYGHGQIILVDDLLLVQAEDGDVVLVEARPDEHRELGRLDALDGRTWNHAALAGRFLVVRNDREAACFELPVVAER